eukprot:scaffold9562_cov63-Phaeocystis_antarctica.AAC.3
MMGPPCCAYGRPAARMLYVSEAQGSWPRAGHDCTYAARVSASGVPHVPRAVGGTPGTHGRRGHRAGWPAVRPV